MSLARNGGPTNAPSCKGGPSLQPQPSSPRAKVTESAYSRQDRADLLELVGCPSVDRAGGEAVTAKRRCGRALGAVSRLGPGRALTARRHRRRGTTSDVALRATVAAQVNPTGSDQVELGHDVVERRPLSARAMWLSDVEGKIVASLSMNEMLPRAARARRTRRSASVRAPRLSPRRSTKCELVGDARAVDESVTRQASSTRSRRPTPSDRRAGLRRAPCHLRTRQGGGQVRGAKLVLEQFDDAPSRLLLAAAISFRVALREERPARPPPSSTSRARP